MMRLFLLNFIILMLGNWKKLSFIPQSNGRKAKIEYTKYFEEFLEHCWQNIILEKSMWNLLHYKLIKTMTVSSLSQSQKFWQNQEIKAEAVAEIIRTRILERIVVPLPCLEYDPQKTQRYPAFLNDTLLTCGLLNLDFLEVLLHTVWIPVHLLGVLLCTLVNLQLMISRNINWTRTQMR